MSLIPYGSLYDAMRLICIGALTAFGLWCCYDWRPRKRNKRSAIPRMYIDAEPEPDSRSSLETFRKVIPKETR